MGRFGNLFRRTRGFEGLDIGPGLLYVSGTVLLPTDRSRAQCARAILPNAGTLSK